MKTNIIGTGVGGLATAVRLAASGQDVEVWEANAYPGGKLSEVWCDDYRFDVGPSVFTLPFLVQDLFELSGLPRTDFKHRPHRFTRILNSKTVFICGTYSTNI